MIFEEKIGIYLIQNSGCKAEFSSQCNLSGDISPLGARGLEVIVFYFLEVDTYNLTFIFYREQLNAHGILEPEITEEEDSCPLSLLMHRRVRTKCFLRKWPLTNYYKLLKHI